MPHLPSPLRRLHWPHLSLLATLPAWLAATMHWPPALRLFAWLALNFVVLGVAEARRPFRRDWRPSSRQWRRDGSVLAINSLVDALASALLALLAIHALPGSSPWPSAAQVAAGLLLAEFGSYWLHRLSHRGGWLWRVHLLHHRPERLNVANALTAHPVNALYDKLVRLAPLVLLGLSPEAIVAVSAFGFTQQLATHANVAGRLGWLNYLVGSAELHRLHHSTRERDAGNFGTTLPLWDQLFGSFRYGAAPDSVGVFEPAHYPSEFELARLLAWPFARGGRVAGAGPDTAARD